MRGSGVSSRFSLSRGPSSCHFIISVVIASRSACFVTPSPPPSSSPSCPMRVVISHLSPHVLRSRPLCPSYVCSSPVFSCGFLSSLPVLATSLAGRSLLACLVHCASRSVVPFSSLASLVPVLACPAGDRPPSSSFPLVVAVVLLVSRRRPSLPLLPVLRQAWAGRVSARRCLLVSLFSPALPRRAVDVRCRLWRAFLLGMSVSAGCCVGFVSGVLYI